MGWPRLNGGGCWRTGVLREGLGGAGLVCRKLGRTRWEEAAQTLLGNANGNAAWLGSGLDVTGRLQPLTWNN